MYPERRGGATYCALKTGLYNALHGSKDVNQNRAAETQFPCRKTADFLKNQRFFVIKQMFYLVYHIAFLFPSHYMYAFARFCALYFVPAPCSMPRQALRSGTARPIFYVNFTIGCMSRTSRAQAPFHRSPLWPRAWRRPSRQPAEGPCIIPPCAAPKRRRWTGPACSPPLRWTAPRPGRQRPHSPARLPPPGWARPRTG